MKYFSRGVYPCPNCGKKEIIFSMPFMWDAIIAIYSIQRSKAILCEREIIHSDISWNCKNCYQDGKIIIR